MKKKLGLLLAMLDQPKLLVLDEPANGLDVESTHLFYDLISASAAQGVTVLFSTHLLDHVTRLCSHAVIISDGEAGAIMSDPHLVNNALLHLRLEEHRFNRLGEPR